MIARLTGVLLAVLVGSGTARAQPPVLDIPEVQTPPRLEAFATAEPPALPGRVDGFRQREPRDGDAVSHGTAAFVSYDRDRLYVVFVCQDDPETVRARISRREESGADDAVSVYLDTFHDRRRAYVFTSNPLGVQSDRMKTEGQEDDESFDTLWYTEGRLTPFGYIVKMSIPFRSLRFPGDAVQVWGIAFSRRIPRLNEEAYWPLVTKRAQAFVPQFADGRGLQRVSPGSNVQVTPYSAFTNARLGTSGTPTSIERRLGFDTKVGIGSAFVLDAAVNPDFSEVESDEPQVTVNERFEVLFPERRPFFVENAGYFNTPIPLFFSRRILDPGVGVRMTGKSGGWVTGGLVAPDRETTDTASALAAVGSVRRDLGRDSHVGALVTLRHTASGTNRVVSADGRWTKGKNWAAVGQLVGTSGVNDGEQASGGALLGEISRSSRRLEILGRYTDISPDFDAALGFIRRVGIRQFDHEVSYRFRPRRGPVVKYGPTLDGFLIWDHAHQMQDWRIRPRFEIDFVGQTSMLVDRARSYERYAGLDFDKQRTTIEFETERSQRVSVSTAYEWGTDINRRPVGGEPASLADRRSVELGIALRPGRRLLYQQTYLLTHLRAPGVAGATGAILSDDILRTKIYYHVSRALSFRGILDYERLAVNRTRSLVRQRQPLGLDLLASYTPNPGTAVFVGYVNRFEPVSVGASPVWIPFVESVGRQFFVKVSWLFRY